ncbi:HPF/RaiA family ribosome-associated protein [Roseomonas eburnea]|uniref:HPF/RaiA family ribosome-associated protein n=1 Tax=Neoroseomonas eburnea TaxID=1346889 RepID=A0A9X9XAP1_9PROT|nr:HPF/RaiA family ribosome-associated protein [Neoroseomonas eburnea]MBR0680777.1 HPF/RaiA family ribosome-associated protein [Neoroseomonas eburnea]
MAIPVQTTFKGMDPSPAMEARIRDKAARLERFADFILRCHVTVEAPHRHHHQGNLYRARIEVDVPRGRIVAGNGGTQDHAHEDPYVALRDAFAAATRQLEDHVRKLGGAVKHHEPGLVPGRIARFVAGEDYGFITLEGGQEVYFHRNSVVGNGFAQLRVGDHVRVAVSEGEKGPQASAVHRVGG